MAEVTSLPFARTREEAEALGANCAECPLRIGGKFVPSTGPDEAELAYVGEAPGRQEVEKGVPFTGPSGRLLNLVNKKYGVKREEVFLTNACLCRPADGTNPPKSAVAACRPRLHRELHDRRVRTIVALGNSAALGTLGVEGITKLRVGPGKSSSYPLLDNVRIVPTVHPAACLRQSDMFPSLVKDIGKVFAIPRKWEEPQVDVYDTPRSAIRIMRQLIARPEKKLTVDIEVDVEKDIAFEHPNRYGLLCVGLCIEKGKAIVIGENACADDRVLDVMQVLLTRKDLNGQNGKFDLSGLYPKLGKLTLRYDTMLGSYVLDERPGIHGLKAQAVEDLGAPQYDEEIKQYVGSKNGYGAIPRDLLYRYCGYDCVCTHDLSELQARRMDASDNESARIKWAELYPELDFRCLRDVHDFLVEASNQFVPVELNGIAVDRAYAAQLEEEYLERLDKLETKIDEILVQAGYVQKNSAGKVIRHNPRSPKQVMEVFGFFRVRAQNTNEETLRAISDALFRASNDQANGYTVKQAQFNDYIETLLLHRREAKLYGTYVKGIIKRLYRSRVYPTFLLHGTTSGRTACRNPNVQNIPRESSIRKLFIPSQPENVFVQADYSQAELRVLTWLAHDEYFREILNDPNRDLFDELTPILYPELPAKDKVPPELWKETRIRVKAFVYGLGYGRTEFSIAKEYKVSVREAQTVKNRFFDAIPSIVTWQQWVKDQVYSGEDLISPFGRHRRFHLITPDNWKSIQNEALSFLPQSTSSDIGLRALGRVRSELHGTGAFVRNFVHDSILADCHGDMAEYVADVLDRHMVQSAREVVGDYVQFRTDVKIGKHWGEV